MKLLFTLQVSLRKGLVKMQDIKYHQATSFIPKFKKKKKC